MFTINVDVVLQIGVGDANEQVLGRLNYLKFEALLSFLWDWQRAVQTCEVASLLANLSSYQLIILKKGRKWVNDKVKD